MTCLRIHPRVSLKTAVCLVWAGIGLVLTGISAATAQQAPAAKPKPAVSPPAAETPEGAVESASRFFEAGRHTEAVAKLTSVISAGSIPAPLLARAFYMRGRAYRQLGKPALAIADLTSAIWFKGGLNDADMRDAKQQRTEAYREANASRADQSTTTAHAPIGQASGLFGPSASSPPAAGARPVASSPPAVLHTPPPPTATIATATIAPAKPPKATHPASIGKYQTRLALVKTRAEADAIVAKLKAQYAPALANHQPEVGEASFGNMGTYFEVRVGPFVSEAQASALCGRLKTSGLDCVAIDR